MARLHDCLGDIDTWMTLNRLKINKEKTELLVLHSRHRSPPAFASLKIGSEVILPSHSARNVGVIFDNADHGASHQLYLQECFLSFKEHCTN